jgi:hypothetical protein
VDWLGCESVNEISDWPGQTFLLRARRAPEF